MEMEIPSESDLNITISSLSSTNYPQKKFNFYTTTNKPRVLNGFGIIITVCSFM